MGHKIRIGEEVCY